MAIRTVFLKRALTSATMAGWVSIFTRICGVAIVIPVAFKVLSAEDTVLWLFFSTVLAFQSIADFGHNSTFARFIAYSRANSIRQHGISELPDQKSLGRLENRCNIRLATILYVISPNYRRVVFFVGVVALPFLSFLAYAPIAASSSPFDHAICWILVCFSLLIQTYGGKYIAILQGFEKISIQRWIEALIGILTNIIAAWLLWIYHSLIFASIAVAAFGLVGISFYFVAAKNVQKFGLPGRRSVTLSESHYANEELWRAAWRSGVGIIAGTGLIQLISISVSNLVAPAAAASFMFTMRVAMIISAISQGPFYNYLPTLARKYREGSIADVRRSARARMASSNLIVAFGFASAGVLFPYLSMKIGMHNQLSSSSVWFALGCAFLIERIGAMHMQLYTLGGRVIWHWVNGITGLVLLCGVLFFTKTWGVIVIPISMAVAYLCVYNMISIPRAYKLLGIKFLDFDVYASLPAGVLMLLYGVFLRLNNYL